MKIFLFYFIFVKNSTLWNPNFIWIEKWPSNLVKSLLNTYLYKKQKKVVRHMGIHDAVSINFEGKTNRIIQIKIWFDPTGIHKMTFKHMQ